MHVVTNESKHGWGQHKTNKLKFIKKMTIKTASKNFAFLA